MATWGGEAIYFDFPGRNNMPPSTLSKLGKPTVVVAGLDLSQGRRPHMVWPGVLNSFVARYLRFERCDSEVHYFSDIRPEHILDLWQPGHPEYDTHPDLPRV
jgi:hypothetical protein